MSASSIINLGRPDADKGLGQAGERVLGTGQSGPAGIESILEYNGLYLNVREWTDTYIVDTISGIDDADVIDSREPNPTDDGETPFAARYGGRTIVLSGKVQTKTLRKLRDMQSALRAAFSDLSSEKALIFRTASQDTDLVLYCKKSGKIEMGEQQTTQNSFERPFQITLRASNPRFVGYKENISRKKWGYTETFSDSSPALLRNEVLSPRGGGGSVAGALAYSAPIPISAGAAPAPLAGSGTAIMASGTMPANRANTEYPGIAHRITLPANIITGVTSLAFYARFLWTAIGATATVSGLLLRWMSLANPGAGFADSYSLNQATPAGLLNTVQEGTFTGTIPSLAGGVKPDAVDIIVYTTHPGNASQPAANYTVYLTDAVLAFNTTTLPTPFDGDSAGAYWSGTPYASASVKYQAYINEWINPDVDPGFPQISWTPGFETLGGNYDGKGGYVTSPKPAGTAPTSQFLGHSSAPQLRAGEVWSFRWSITAKVTGMYYTDIRAANSSVSKTPIETTAATNFGTFMEAGKTYTFNIENWTIPAGVVGTPAINHFVIKRNSDNSQNINFVTGEDITWSGMIAIKGKVTPGMMSVATSPIIRGDGLSSEWNLDVGRGYFYSLNDRVYFNQRDVRLTRKTGAIAVPDRAIRMRFRTPPSVTASAGTLGIMTRKTNNSNFISGVVSPNGNNSASLQIATTINGSGVIKITSSAVAIAASTDYILSLFVAGNDIVLTLSSITGTVLRVTSYSLAAGSEQTTLGAGITGDDAISYFASAAPASRPWSADEFVAEPYSVGPSVSHEVVNAGDYAAQPIIRIYGVAALDSSVPANAGKIAMTLLNESTGEVLAIKCKDGSFTAIGNDRYIELDIAKKTMREYVASTGALVGNAFDRLDPGSDWMTLKAGKNTLTTRYFFSSGTPQVDVRWRRTHM